MAPTECQTYTDIATVLGNQDRKQAQLFDIEIAGGSLAWLSKIEGPLLKIARSKDAPINRADIRKAIKEGLGTHDKRKELAAIYISLLQKHPGTTDMMEDFAAIRISEIEKSDEIVRWSSHGKIDLASLPENVLKNLINDLIFFSVKLDELWVYHPDNPEGINLLKEYENLQEKVYQIEEEINQLN